MLERTVDAAADPRWSCVRKKAYPTSDMAARVAAKSSQRGGVDLVSYGCTHCGSYHIGHAPR